MPQEEADLLLQVERAEHLARLARIRGVSLSVLLDDLGIQEVEHG